MNKFKELARQLALRYEQESMYLCDLDRAAGDGDHGITISRGFHEAYEQVKQLPDDANASTICKTIGYGMLNSMGGASGPIFSMFFIQAAIQLQEETYFTKENLSAILSETIAGIKDLAGTKRNEKTMMDALYGAQDALLKSNAITLHDVLSCLLEGATQGAEATIQMMATKGRAKFLQERSIGFMDAGSWSVVILFQTLRKVFEE